MKHTIVACFALAIFCIPSQSHSMDGEGLRDFCKRNDSLVTGYVAGMMDYRQALISWFLPRVQSDRPQESKDAISEDLLRVGGNICIPQGASYGQGRDVVCKYIADHPQHRHLNGDELVFKALEAAWPCT